MVSGLCRTHKGAAGLSSLLHDAQNRRFNIQRLRQLFEGSRQARVPLWRCKVHFLNLRHRRGCVDEQVGIHRFNVNLDVFLVIIRGIILKGVGLRLLYQEAIALILFGVAIVLLAATRFRKRLE